MVLYPLSRFFVLNRTKRYFLSVVISCCYHFIRKQKNDNIFSFFKIFFHFFRCIFDSNNFHPQGNYHELFESSDQNKPATTCSRADHVGFQTDSVTTNSNSESTILNCDKVAKLTKSRKFIELRSGSQIH